MRALFPSLCAVAMAACGGATQSQPSSIANAVEAAPRRRAQSGICGGLPSEVEPITAAELGLEVTPDDAGAARSLLLGPWTGHAFELDNALGTPGSNPRPAGARAVCFDVDGHVTNEDDRVEGRGDNAECKPRSRTYRLHRDEDSGDHLTLEERITGGCPDDAGYDAPHKVPYYVSRLDERFLVVMDGVTGAVSGYRRR